MSERAALIPLYRRVRKAGQILNGLLADHLDREVMTSGASALGLLHQGTTVFGSETEAEIPMDYCVHDVPVRGRTTAERTS